MWGDVGDGGDGGGGIGAGVIFFWLTVEFMLNPSHLLTFFSM